jgi:hypothetical protein
MGWCLGKLNACGGCWSPHLSLTSGCDHVDDASTGSGRLIGAAHATRAPTMSKMKGVYIS